MTVAGAIADFIGQHIGREDDGQILLATVAL